VNKKLLFVIALLMGIVIGASTQYIFVQAIYSGSNMIKKSFVPSVISEPNMQINSSSVLPYYPYQTYTFSLDSWISSLRNVYKVHLEGFNETLVYETQTVYPLNMIPSSPPKSTPVNITLPAISKIYVVIYIDVLDKNGDILYLKNAKVTMWDQDFKIKTNLLTISGEVWINTSET
jgi:hypothetical protein